MNDNVISFDNFDSEQQIGAHQAGLVRVVLEGQTDVILFRRFWFSKLLDTFDFVEASHVAGGAGCTAVRAAVAKSRDVDGVPAVGIMDRDNLFREGRWELLFAVDDAHFASEVYTADVYVTSLWEVEAYLLQPDLLAHWVAGSYREPPGPEAECERALTRALGECEVLLAAASFFAAVHATGEACKAAYFRGESLERVETRCADKFMSASEDYKKVALCVKDLVAGVLAKQAGSEADRLLFLLRYVDTKRLLIRLFHTLHVRDDTHWTLATLMHNGGRRPAELERFLTDVATRVVA